MYAQRRSQYRGLAAILLFFLCFFPQNGQAQGELAPTCGILLGMGRTSLLKPTLDLVHVLFPKETNLYSHWISDEPWGKRHLVVIQMERNEFKSFVVAARELSSKEKGIHFTPIYSRSLRPVLLNSYEASLYVLAGLKALLFFRAILHLDFQEASTHYVMQYALADHPNNLLGHWIKPVRKDLDLSLADSAKQKTLVRWVLRSARKRMLREFRWIQKTEYGARYDTVELLVVPSQDRRFTNLFFQEGFHPH